MQGAWYLLRDYADGGTPLAEDGSEWTFAIGTGLQLLNAEGDVGLTALGDARYGDLDLSPEDFADMMDSMFGFTGYAENDRWKISVTYGTLTLKDDAAFELRGPFRNPLEARVKQDITFAEGTVEYRFNFDLGRSFKRRQFNWFALA